MKFNEIFYEKFDGDVLLIQPNMLQKIKPKYIDPVQTDYWENSEKVGSLLSIAGNLKRDKKCSMRYLDFHLYDYVKLKIKGEFIESSDILKILKNKKSKVILISVMTLSHYYALEIAKICKQINPETFIVLGGLHFSFLPNEAFKEKAVDAVLCGEGEESISKLLDCIIRKEDFTTIDGLILKENKEKTVEWAYVKDLNTLSLSAYELWAEDVPFIPRVYTARGCNGKCDYCVVNNFFSNTYRRKDIFKIMEEIEYLTKNLKCKELLIGDLNLGASIDETIKLCRLIVEKNIKIQWWCQTRADGLNEEVLYWMSKAGCVQIGIGIESNDKDILVKSSSMKKNLKIDTEELCKLIKKYGMQVQGYFIIGLPNESINSAISTIKYIDYLTSNNFVDITHIAVLVPYPGTPIYENPKKYNIKILTYDYSKYIMNCDYMNTGIPVIETENLSEYQIYSLWQLAISTASKNFKKRKALKVPNLFKDTKNFYENLLLK